MRTKILFTLLVVSSIAVTSTLFFSTTLAQEVVNTGSVRYPVEELGNCRDKAACKAYCDEPEHTEACLSFAEKKGLMSQKEVQTAKRFLDTEKERPGGCGSEDTCEEYCSAIAHIDECISFAEKNDLLPPKELQEAKQVQSAIARGIKPPACGNKKACDAYCDASDHIEECVTFAEAAGFLRGEELNDAKKMLAAMKRGVKPPPCHGKEECDLYCSDPEHMEVCMSFAMEAGFMSDEEKANAEKMLGALKKGIQPPKCRGKEECDIYCGEEAHFEECVSFAEAAGFMNSDEAMMARKTGGKGPGGCKGEEECKTFCDDPQNQETCFNFSKEHGLIPEEDLREMEEGKQQLRQSLEQAPQEVLECLTTTLGAEKMESYKNGTGMPSPEVGDHMKQCFEKEMRPMQVDRQEGPGPGMMPDIQGGPGGCKTPEECEAFCESDPQACQNFGDPSRTPLEDPATQRAPLPYENKEQRDTYPTPNDLPCRTPEECRQMTPRSPDMYPCEGDDCRAFPAPAQSDEMRPNVESSRGESIDSQTVPSPEQMPQPQPFIPQSPSPETAPSMNRNEPRSLLGSVLHALARFLFL